MDCRKSNVHNILH